MKFRLIASPPAKAAEPPKLFRAGTLAYTQEGLYVLFFWLMWNDFMIMLLEQPNQFGVLLQLANGASYTQLSIFSTIALVVTFWINPVFSTWSDRTRTRWGRRRPFLFFTAPPVALFIAIMPFMPEIYHYLSGYPAMVSILKITHMSGPVLMLGVNGIIIAVFNNMLLAIFSYLYWDIVPQEVLGRFTSLTKIVTSVLTLVWSFFIYGLAQNHMKTVCVSISIFALAAYLLSVYNVREGDWPPPDEHRTGGMLAPVRAYFVECYSRSYYLWIFLGLAISGVANSGASLKTHYVNFDLHLTWDLIGKMNAVPQAVGILLGFFFGSITDRFHPVRMFPPTFLAMSAASLGSYFFITGAWSYLIWTCLTQVAAFANGVAYGALLPEIYPREKLGQFCSAAVLFQTAVSFMTGIPTAMLFDALGNDRLAYLWSAAFLCLAAIVFYKVLDNFHKLNDRPPVPHAA